MPQPTGYGDDDGDDKVLMVTWRMIIIIMFDFIILPSMCFVNFTFQIIKFYSIF